MTTEFELDCATCGSPLARREITAEALGFGSPAEVEIAECQDCGERYFPESTLQRLGT
ncbi:MULTISPECIES: hypothetical protein [Halorussus]|uniref:hypothetical protein n=1 Tax=Halorussus TaxID=1070314 RepID=UPI00209F93BC|nr:hypothetical protein [Halorussus vallis]USZ76850.1 hypothetical protein NGM07_05855 [Halorussus vallis]